MGRKPLVPTQGLNIQILSRHARTWVMSVWSPRRNSGVRVVGVPVPSAAYMWHLHTFCALPWRNHREWCVEKPHGLCFSRTGVCSPSKTLAGSYASSQWDTGKEHTPEGLGPPKRDHCSESATWNQEHVTEGKCVHCLFLFPVVERLEKWNTKLLFSYKWKAKIKTHHKFSLWSTR